MTNSSPQGQLDKIKTGYTKLFSTFLMWMLADLFHDLPEVGDADKPKLVFFFDAAHLLFYDAKILKAAVSTFPHSGYDLEGLLTQLGTGGAVITLWSERGAPTPVA